MLFISKKERENSLPNTAPFSEGLQLIEFKMLFEIRGDFTASLLIFGKDGLKTGSLLLVLDFQLCEWHLIQRIRNKFCSDIYRKWTVCNQNISGNLVKSETTLRLILKPIHIVFYKHFTVVVSRTGKRILNLFFGIDR